MNKGISDNLSPLFIDLDDHSNDNLISVKLRELKTFGFNQIKLEVKSSSKQMNTSLLLDIDVFRKIKEVQDLPDWVIIRLILAAGILKESGIGKRISNV